MRANTFFDRSLSFIRMATTVKFVTVKAATVDFVTVKQVTVKQVTMSSVATRRGVGYVCAMSALIDAHGRGRS
jgi:hypothetical protein